MSHTLLCKLTEVQIGLLMLQANLCFTVILFRKTLSFQALAMPLKSASLTALRVSIFVRRKKAFISEDKRLNLLLFM